MSSTVKVSKTAELQRVFRVNSKVKEADACVKVSVKVYSNLVRSVT